MLSMLAPYTPQQGVSFVRFDMLCVLERLDNHNSRTRSQLQGTLLKPQDFEVYAGNATSKKWRHSIRVRGTKHDGMKLGHYLNHVLKVRSHRLELSSLLSTCYMPSRKPVACSCLHAQFCVFEQCVFWS